MKRIIIFTNLTTIGLFCSLPFFAKAGDIQSTCTTGDERIISLAMPLDTLPAAAKPAEATTGNPAKEGKPMTEKPVAIVIKEVPKARKVAVPRQVNIKVKPVKVVKPKLIKPVLKVL
jgi:hypothetical protein